MDFNKLRLKYHGNEAKQWEILQLECREKCKKKLYKTIRNDNFIFPSLAVAEMSTSDDVADIHASIVPIYSTVLDMTAGLGIDAFSFAKKGCDVTAIELSHDNAEALRHNRNALSLDNVEIIEGDSVKWLEAARGAFFDYIFIDPARRDMSGRHITLKQCVPDVTSCISTLRKKSNNVIIKMSPMIDIVSAKKELGDINCKVMVIGTKRECKEVLFIIPGENSVTHDCGFIECVTVGHGSYKSDSDRILADNTYVTPTVGDYLLQPYPAVMKGLHGNVAGYAKLQAMTHLYVAETLEKCTLFPGQAYKIIEILPFNKHSTRVLSEKQSKYNVVTRNFPLSSPELVAKLHLKEGGNDTLFGVTLQDNSKVLIIAENN